MVKFACDHSARRSCGAAGGLRPAASARCAGPRPRSNPPLVRQRAAGRLIEGIAALARCEEFGRGIYRILRRVGLRPQAFAKVWAFPAKLLAMQRASL